MRKDISIQLQINSIIQRQKDIEHTITNKRVIVDDDWREFVAEMKKEYETNAERIGYLQSQLKLLKLEAL